MEPQRYECEGGCDFWKVLHGNPDNIDYKVSDKLKACSGCQKPERLNAYKEFWGERSKT